MAVPSLQVGGIKWTVNLKTGLKNHGKKRVLEQFLIVWLGKSAYIAPGVVLMPSFVNLGAYVDEGTMVDTWQQ